GIAPVPSGGVMTGGAMLNDASQLTPHRVVTDAVHAQGGKIALFQQHVPQYDSGQEVSENQLLAALRFVTSLEHLRQQQPLLTYQT
ncbi:STY4199 family HEPN domain-containing protein, partial [Salmonella enterica subsp. enterica serovar Anatum]|nr:STY4199 family HEPN domain-containing protein [Salmonella enterica subsp. enterica serovar Anatum]